MHRRTFLHATGAGVLALGVKLGCALAPTGGPIVRQHRRTGEFQPNAWIRVLASGTIVFTLDRVEMGQGTLTSHAMLVAEELEVDPRELRIEHARASRAYDNPDRLIRVQITGGSTSTRSSWTPLREAGAVAREMLRAGAAARWGVPIAECVAKDGAIHHTSGRSASYGELVAIAAAQDVPKVALKPPSRWRWIGRSLDRLDARAKVDGTGVYGIDVKLPGMVTAVLLRPPVPGAKLTGFDASAARGRRGFVDAVQVGDAVAVAATGYWEARTAAERVVVRWHEGHGATIDSDALHSAFVRLAARRGTRTPRNVGAALRALGTAPLDVTYAVPYLAHATMEPQNATAWLRDGRCEVWAPTQTPGIARWRVADAIGFDLDDVAIHTTMIGGGFGRRGLVDYAVEAARVAQRLARPVKVVWSREDDQTHDWYRPMAVARMRGAARPGAITAWHQHLVSQSIVADEAGDFVGGVVPDRTPRALRRMLADSVPRATARGVISDPTAIEGAAELPYAIANLRVEYTPVETGVPVGFWRSVGHSFNAFFTECFLDELCAVAGLDPLAARRALLARHPRHLGVLELAAAKAGWGRPLAAGVGRGLAVHASFGSYCAQVIEASLEANRVRVHRVVVALDCGRVVNPQLVAAQVESGVVFGLSAALAQRITFRRGRVQETNFHTFRALRLHECPPIEVHVVPSEAHPSGVGEPTVPPVAPALCNALFAATGQRIRRLPIAEALRS
jgi:isoquinoline 1-oxidoreductase subunit beta